MGGISSILLLLVLERDVQQTHLVMMVRCTHPFGLTVYTFSWCKLVEPKTTGLTKGAKCDKKCRFRIKIYLYTQVINLTLCGIQICSFIIYTGVCPSYVE